MALDIFKEDVSDIKIRKNDYQNKVDSIIEDTLDIDIDGVNLLDMKEEKKVKKNTSYNLLRRRRIRNIKICMCAKKYNSSKDNR
ncbi:hypothetical protein [Paraclostridium sp. AKS73]|uniref:hypothetical protein n=1 Tax=Paraclostridium sp. AKS73 TaxID=2876116 RepID=UPI0021DF90A3|nr:hypothetical protein [Paraclostridium sp. AKS73]MCU9816574.1 hypothetical protein [Paraclostridium sp. AKS73]